MGVDLTNDERLAAVNTERNTEINNSNTRFDNMISESDGFYQDQVDATREWAETQRQNQQAQTDFAIEKIEQQKDQTRKDYIKEQSGAYTDWQKQSNQYGVNAEKQASSGLANTGYSESSQVSMYNAYQNRVASARESYARAVLNYENAIKEARLQNNSILAEIAYEALQKELELSLAGFQYKNTLLLQKAESERAIRNDYFSKWKAVLDQINTENAQAEQKRQFNEQMAFQREQFEYQKSKDAKEAQIVKTANKRASQTKARSKIRANQKGTTTISTKSSKFSGSTYDAAVEYMTKNGVPNSDASGIMTKGEWQRRKGSYQYSTYKEYLADVVEYQTKYNGK